MSIWQQIANRELGYLSSIGEALHNLHSTKNDAFNSVECGEIIFCSDYSGQHKTAKYETYSFVITTDLFLRKWLPLLGDFRQKYLPDGRRLSFKKLNEPMRKRSLEPFLKVASLLEGNLVSVMIDKRLGSICPGGTEGVKEVFDDCFPPIIKDSSVEKMFRLASLSTLLIAGFRTERQTSFWVSDHDEALDTNEKREGLARLSAYLAFGLTGWQNPADQYFTTTGLSTAPLWSEDLATIADFAAGAYCEMSSMLPTLMGTPKWLVGMSSTSIKDWRAQKIGNWLATNTNSLKHVLIRMEDDGNAGFRTSAQIFQSLR